MSYIFSVEQLKKAPIKRTVSFVTVLAVLINVALFNGVFLSFPQQAAANTVPAGVIVAWPSTDGTIPAGWSRVTALDGYYLEGSTSTPSGSALGSANHTHTSPTHTHDIGHTHTGATNNSTGLSTTGSGTGAAADAHSHTITTDANVGTNNPASSNFDTSPNDPPYTEVIWIQSNGTTGIPDGAWALYNSDTLPTNWSRQSGGRFLKGAPAAGNGGATGGSSNAHSHTDLGHTHTQNAHTHTGTTGVTASEVRAGGGTGLSATGHTHTISGGSTTATEQSGAGVVQNGDAQPPFYTLNIIENNTGSNEVPNEIIAMWTGNIGSVPAGWEVCDGSGNCPNLNDSFIKGAAINGEIGTTGGALSHTHTAGAAHSHTINGHTHNFTVDADAGAQVGTQGGGNSGANYTHTHTLSISDGDKTTGTQTVTADANADNRPPYKEAVFIQYKASSISQSDFRVYENVDAIQPATALAGQNIAAIDISQDQVIRLRINLFEASSTIATSSTQFKLQYANKGAALTCPDVPSVNFSDVGQAASSTIWRGYDNTNVSAVDGASVTSALLSNTTVLQTYEEENPSVANPRTIGVGDRAEWDWVVQNNGATSTDSYCFRMVTADGSIFSAYTTMPEVTIVRGLIQTRYRWRNDDGGE